MATVPTTPTIDSAISWRLLLLLNLMLFQSGWLTRLDRTEEFTPFETASMSVPCSSIVPPGTAIFLITPSETNWIVPVTRVMRSGTIVTWVFCPNVKIAPFTKRSRATAPVYWRLLLWQASKVFDRQRGMSYYPLLFPQPFVPLFR